MLEEEDEVSGIVFLYKTKALFVKLKISFPLSFI